MVQVQDLEAALVFYEALGTSIVPSSRDGDFLRLSIGDNQLSLLANPPNPPLLHLHASRPGWRSSCGSWGNQNPVEQMLHRISAGEHRPCGGAEPAPSVRRLADTTSPGMCPAKTRPQTTAVRGSDLKRAGGPPLSSPTMAVMSLRDQGAPNGWVLTT